MITAMWPPTRYVTAVPGTDIDALNHVAVALTLNAKIYYIFTWYKMIGITGNIDGFFRLNQQSQVAGIGKNY